MEGQLAGRASGHQGIKEGGVEMSKIKNIGYPRKPFKIYEKKIIK
jgi:hypothetical protein